MEIIRNFIIIVLIAIFLTYIFSKIMLKESFILNKITKAFNNPNFNENVLYETLELLQLILSTPESILYDVTGSSVFINNIYINITNVTYLEAKDAVNKLIANIASYKNKI